jgi:hypothetical protein
MVSLTEARENPARQLWDEVNSVHAGMLGLEGLHNHMQPMAPHADPKTNTIWFFSKKDTDLITNIISQCAFVSASSDLRSIQYINRIHELTKYIYHGAYGRDLFWISFTSVATVLRHRLGM